MQPNATVITIFAGVNEINTITAALGGGAGGSDPNGLHRRAGAGVRRRLRDAVCGIRERGPARARLVVSERAEHGRTAVPGGRVAGAAAGGAARRGRHDANRRQSARLGEHGRSSI